MKRLQYKKHNQEDGTILLLGLAVMSFLLIPLLGILAFSSQATTASVTANGLAVSSANAALTRSIDIEATFQNRQSQLYAPGSSDANKASSEVDQAVQSAWKVSQSGTGGNGRIRMMAVGETSNGFKFSSPDNAASASKVGIINLPNDSSANYIQVQGSSASQGCSGNSAFSNGAVYDKPTTESNKFVVCWVDHLAKNSDGSFSTNRNPTGWLGSDAQQWDHYSSGAETALEINLGAPWPLNLTSDFKAIFPGVATFSGSCAASQKCSQ